MNLNACVDVQPGDIFFVDPFAVEVREELRGGQQSTNDDIMDMAVSLHIHGQRRAVECRQIEDNRLLLDHGFTRTFAARLIRSGFKYIDTETKLEIKIKDKNFKLKVVILGPTALSRKLP
jgi:hypothetical protein